MPNSDGNGTVSTNRSVDRPMNENQYLLNGIHESEKQTQRHGNGDTSIVNMNGAPISYTTSEISSTSPLTMKIIRKRHSDSEMMHENSKKTKMDCDTPQSEPSPLVNDITHESRPLPSIESDEGKSEEGKVKVDDGCKDHTSKHDNADNESSSSSVIVIDEDNDAFPESESKQKVPSKSCPRKEDISSENHIDDMKTEVKEEIEIQNDMKEVGTQSDSLRQATSKDERLLLRADVLSIYGEKLRKATSSSLALLQQMTQSRILHNGSWQVKYHHLHNRFLHLKVSTDKMVENMSKEEKQLRSVEAQTDMISQELESKDMSYSSIQTVPEVNTEVSSISQSPSQRSQVAHHHGTNSPSKTTVVSALPSVIIHNTGNSGHSTLPSQSQQLQNSSLTQSLPLNHQQQAVSKSVSHLVEKQMQPPEQQPQQQTEQHLLLLSQTASLPNASAVTLPTSANVIDLTDDDSSAALASTPTSSIRPAGVSSAPRGVVRQTSVIHDSTRVRHPMPLPRMTAQSHSHGCCRGLPPPSPQLTVTRTDDGVCLQWNIPNYTPSVYSKIKRYRLFNYSQTSQSVFYSFQNPWKEIGSVDSMDLPMACTLTQIQENSIYYFAIRPVDEYERLGVWSNTATIEMTSLDS